MDIITSQPHGWNVTTLENVTAHIHNTMLFSPVLDNLGKPEVGDLDSSLTRDEEVLQSNNSGR